MYNIGSSRRSNSFKNSCMQMMSQVLKYLLCCIILLGKISVAEIWDISRVSITADQVAASLKFVFKYYYTFFSSKYNVGHY